ncbi:MAG: type II secretion system protein [Dehalococcoidia bacterium]|jgi:type II secretory pathway pseudopilin PulG
MQALKKWGLGPRKSGFTLIELLVVMAILAILAGVVVIAVGGSFGSAQSNAYTIARDDIFNAMIAYAADNNGYFPVNDSIHMPINADCATATSCHIIDMSALLVKSEGMFYKMPEGVAALSGDEDDNCDQGSGTTCNKEGHYIWGMSPSGNIVSYCTDQASEAEGTCISNASGYQGIWP